MIALVKTHASIGKSILTVEKVFELPQDEVILVEDSMAGFRSAKISGSNKLLGRSKPPFNGSETDFKHLRHFFIG